MIILNNHSLIASLAAVSTLPLAAPRATAADPAEPNWEIRLLAVDANEGVAVADIDNDGRLDVVAGRSWYRAPEFTPHPLRIIEDWNGYARTNGDYAYDVDADGRTDIIAGDFISGEVHWFKNPGPKGLAKGHLWEKRLLGDTGCATNEGQLLQDLDGDGVPEWIVNSWKRPQPQLVWRLSNDGEDSAPAISRCVVNVQGNGHGLGVGDINGDGLLDILCGSGWYECPGEAERYEHPWPFHPDWEFTNFSLPVLVRDLDGDGRNDLLWGSAHDFGLQWWRQEAPDPSGVTNWTNHQIDDSFSQAHTLAWADIDGDGADELVTGKRYLAHNGADPGSDMPPCLHYYKWDPESREFQRHVINRGIVGAGLQIGVGDLDGDGRVDLAVSGKGGAFVLFNRPPE